MKNKWLLLFAIVFGVTIVIRVLYATAVPYFSDDESYMTLRLVDIASTQHGFLYADNLSYDGRTYVMNPFLYNILGFMNQQHYYAIYFYKILSSLFASSLIVIVYAISRRLVPNNKYAFATATIASFVPLFFIITLNSFNVFSFLLPLFFLAIFFYIKHIQTNKMSTFIPVLITFFISSIIHPIFIVLLLGMLFYTLFLWQEKKQPRPFENELLLFLLLLYTGINYILYYNALVLHGIKIFWQHIAYSPYVGFLDIIGILPQIGLLMFLAAAFIVYMSFHKDKNPFVFLIAGLMTSSLALTILRVISAEIGFLFLSFFSVLLLPYFFDYIEKYVTTTKMPRLRHIAFYSIVAVLLLSNFIPTIIYSQLVVQQSTDPSLVDALTWIKNTTAPNALVIVPLELGHTTMYFSNRSTVMDSAALFVFDTDTRSQNLRDFYSSIYTSQAMENLEELGVKKSREAYIVINSQIKKITKDPQLQFLNTDCFAIVYANSKTVVYRAACEVNHE